MDNLGQLYNPQAQAPQAQNLGFSGGMQTPPDWSGTPMPPEKQFGMDDRTKPMGPPIDPYKGMGAPAPAVNPYQQTGAQIMGLPPTPMPAPIAPMPPAKMPPVAAAPPTKMGGALPAPPVWGGATTGTPAPMMPPAFAPLAKPPVAFGLNRAPVKAMFR